MLNALSGHLAIALGVKGPNLTVSTACSAGAHAIGLALDLIRHRRADVMVAGGAEACILPLTLAGFRSLRCLSTGNKHTPSLASRPLARYPDRIVLPQGAGILPLGSWPPARRRGVGACAERA